MGATVSNFGEPWWVKSGVVFDKEGNQKYTGNDKMRAAACVNACAGMKDPEAEIDALRECAEQLQSFMLSDYPESCWPDALAKLARARGEGE